MNDIIGDKILAGKSAAMESDITNILNLLGVKWDEHTFSTPKRFIKYLQEFCQPFQPDEVLGSQFPSDGVTSMVVQGPIAFRGICAHHLCPMLGTAYFGYIPNKKVVGLSKIARLVQAVGTEKPGIQEYMCDRICDLFNEYVEPKGCICVIKSLHTCMSARGIAMPNVYTSTSSVKGVFLVVPAARQEFFELTK
jgi:GTP cyclohydrolase I